MGFRYCLEGSCPPWQGSWNRPLRTMSITTANVSIELLMDTTSALQEIESRVTARAFAAVVDPAKGPALREVLARLAAVLDETSDDGVI